MKYLYYKSEKGNFGDDLNPWLWEQFFGKNDDTDPNVFLGIGSILYNDFPLIKPLKDTQHKIVFGSGIRPTHNTFKIDNTWDIRFLRGPLSAASLQNNKFKYIADAAYAMRVIKGFDDKFLNQPKKHEVGLMPYFKSVDYFDWQKICDKLGFYFISPYSENGVEHTINEIASCKVLITEAMHGAIIADILRVPWNRYVLSTPATEGAMVSEFKWMDWLHSIGLGSIDTTFIKFYTETRINTYIKNLSFDVINATFLFKSFVNKNMLQKLAAINQFYLSEDKVISIIDDKIEEEILKLRSDLQIK